MDIDKQLERLVGKTVRVALFEDKEIWPMTVQSKNENDLYPVVGRWNTIYISRRTVKEIINTTIYMKTKVIVH